MLSIELRKKSIKELIQLEEESRAELFALRFQASIGNNDKPHRIKLLKIRIARVLTILSEAKKNGQKIDRNFKVDLSKTFKQIETDTKTLFKKRRSQMDKMMEEQQNQPAFDSKEIDPNEAMFAQAMMGSMIDDNEKTTKEVITLPSETKQIKVEVPATNKKVAKTTTKKAAVKTESTIQESVANPKISKTESTIQESVANPKISKTESTIQESVAKAKSNTKESVTKVKSTKESVAKKPSLKKVISTDKKLKIEDKDSVEKIYIDLNSILTPDIRKKLFAAKTLSDDPIKLRTLRQAIGNLHSPIDLKFNPEIYTQDILNLKVNISTIDAEKIYNYISDKYSDELSLKPKTNVKNIKKVIKEKK